MRPRMYYRKEFKGGGVLIPGIITPKNVLTSPGTLVLLIHGYNNNRDEAEKTYEQFFTRQEELGKVYANVVSVYWPGDNWEGPAYYMQALGKVQDVVPALANDLCNAAIAKGHLSVNIIAHSLGCRLTLETLDQVELRCEQEDIPIVINSVVFMAGAVPVSFLDEEEDGRLLPAFDSVGKTMSIFSTSDGVLHYAFPIGELLGDGVSFPTALGRQKWNAGYSLPNPIRQEDNPDAGHSDYWGGDSTHIQQLQRAAKYIRSFIDLGTPPPRSINSRALTARDTLSPRATTQGRTIDTRNIC